MNTHPLRPELTALAPYPPYALRVLTPGQPPVLHMTGTLSDCEAELERLRLDRHAPEALLTLRPCGVRLPFPLTYADLGLTARMVWRHLRRLPFTA